MRNPRTQGLPPRLPGSIVMMLEYVIRPTLFENPVPGNRKRASPFSRDQEGAVGGFASRFSVSRGYLSPVEHARNEVGAEVLFAISRELRKSLEWLFTGGGVGPFEIWRE
jgi:hypothetical protein